jgi:hypothetical protein
MVQGANPAAAVSAPIAQKILEESLALEARLQSGHRHTWIRVGSFAQIEAVDYKKRGRAYCRNSLPPAGAEDRKRRSRRLRRSRRTRAANRDDADIRAARRRGRLDPRRKPAREGNGQTQLLEKIFGLAANTQPPAGRRTSAFPR